MTRRIAYIVTTAVTVTTAIPVWATEVGVQISSRETYVGVPVQVQLTIRNAEHYEAPEPPAVEGASVRFRGGPQQSSQVSIINGRMNQEVSVAYAFDITPTREGTITVPPFVVRVDGDTKETGSFEIVATKSESRDLLFVQVQGAREALYVGESVDLVLQIWIKPFQDPRLRMKLSEADMWSLVAEESQWGVFTDALQEMARRRERPGGREVLRADSDGDRRSYYRYEIHHTIWPDRAGTIDVGNINIVVSYPTGLVRDNSFFSFRDVRLAGTRPVVAAASVPPIDVRPIPTEGQPPFYRGAVGEYSIEATAKPTDVRVGDPITLTLTLRGTGRLDLLQAPPLDELPQLTADFQVPDEQLAGVVEGGAKEFTQSIRARSDAVIEIPPIPFAYFDPQSERFVVLESDPIPLTVAPAERMAVSQIVEGDTGPPVTTHLTQMSGGLLANYHDMDEVLTDQRFQPGPSSAAAATVPPALFAAAWVVRRRRDRLRTDRGYARRRSARRNALHSIGQASQSSAPAAAEAVAGGVLGYVADRCDLPAGLTRVEAIEALRSRNVPSEVVDRADSLLRRCDDLRYAGATQNGTGDLVEQARQCIAELERRRF